jgi:hypothetical protein
MYESNPTAITPLPCNPRAFDLRLPPYRWDLTEVYSAWSGIWPLDSNLLSGCPLKYVYSLTLQDQYLWYENLIRTFVLKLFFHFSWFPSKLIVNKRLIISAANNFYLKCHCHQNFYSLKRKCSVTCFENFMFPCLVLEMFHFVCNNIHKDITRLWLVDLSAVNPKQQCNFL